MPIKIPNTDRRDLANLYAELGFKEGAEIGVAEGTFSKMICEANPKVKLHCIDSWVKYRGYNDFAGDFFSQAHETAHKLLDQYDCNFIKKYSMDAVKDFADGSLDFVYIDANHDIWHILEDLREWSKKVKPGGLISGHDWFISMHNKSIHIVYALEAYTKSFRIVPWFVLGRDERLPGERRERSRSWFFVKE